jgi:hypothetical protein
MSHSADVPNEPAAGAGSSGWLRANQAGFGETPASESVGWRIEPTLGGAFAHAWNILKADFWSLLLIGFVALLLGGAVGTALQRGPSGGLLSFLYQYLVGVPIFYGAAYAWLRAVRGQRPELGDLFVPFRRNWLSSVLAQILVTVVVVVGFILLIVPGIFLAVRLAFVPFLVVDEGRGPMDAVMESFNRTSGYGWTILGAALLSILVVIVGFILLVVGSIPATLLVYLAFASLYAGITARKRSSAQGAVA